MLEITEIKLSKNPVSTGEEFKISIQIVEKKSYPYRYPRKYPVSQVSLAKPVKNNTEGERK